MFLVINRFIIDHEIHKNKSKVKRKKKKTKRMVKLIAVLAVFSLLFATRFSSVKV